MKDGIIKGTGDSRYLKGAGWPTTYAEFKSMAEAGTLPFDLNGINEAGWQQIGDALNKGNLLDDVVSSKIGDAGTVSEAFDILGRLHSEIANDYVWAKQPNEDCIVEGSTSGFRPYSTNYASDVFAYHAAGIDGQVAFSGEFIPTHPPTSEYVDYWAGILPFFYMDATSGRVGKATSIRSDPAPDETSIAFNSVLVSASGDPTISYVNAPNPDAYPPSVPDGYAYTSRRAIGNSMTRSYVSSYVGTGTYGSGNKNSLTIPFAPKALIIFEKSGSNWTMIFLGSDAATVFTNTSIRSTGLTVSWYGPKIVKWHSSSAEFQLNATSKVYNCISIG